MKISDLMIEIKNDADTLCHEKLTDHVNDGIAIGIFYNGFEWQVGVNRPTQRQLDSGEVEDPSTMKVMEVETRFYTVGHTLMSALLKMQKSIRAASEWDDG